MHTRRSRLTSKPAETNSAGIMTAAPATKSGSVSRKGVSPNSRRVRSRTWRSVAALSRVAERLRL